MLTISENGTVVAGGTPIEELAKAGKLKIGDYVAYTPDTEETSEISTVSLEIDTLSNKTYKATTEKTGYDVDQIIEQERLNWRIFSIDENTGKVELISETPTHRALALQGSIGWLNAEEELNNTCKVLYSNNKLGEARHLTMEDINKAVGFNPETEVEGYNDEESTREEIYYPDKDGTLEIEDGNGYVNKSLKYGIYTRPAGKMLDYGYYLSDVADETIRDIVLGTSRTGTGYYKGSYNGKWYYETSDGRWREGDFYSSWIATRSVSFLASNSVAYFNVGCIYNYIYGALVDTDPRLLWHYNNYLFSNNSTGWGYRDSDYFSLRPIVSLKSGVQVDTDDGLEDHSTPENAWKIQ